MADFTRPDALPEWASEQADPAHIAEPPQQRKKDGWDTDPPPHSYFNWWMRKVYEWIGWARDNLDRIIDAVPDDALDPKHAFVGATELAHSSAAGLEADPILAFGSGDLPAWAISPSYENPVLLAGRIRLPIGAKVTGFALALEDESDLEMSSICLTVHDTSGDDWSWVPSVALVDNATASPTGTSSEMAWVDVPLDVDDHVVGPEETLHFTVQLPDIEGMVTFRFWGCRVTYEPSQLAPAP